MQLQRFLLKIFDRSVSEYDILQWQAIQIQNRCDLLNISHKPWKMQEFSVEYVDVSKKYAVINLNLTLTKNF